MKTNILISILLMFFFCNLEAQNLFPMHVGDKWIYWEYPNSHEVFDIVKDTVMSNGKHYYEMKENGSLYEYYRQQGDSVFTFDPNINNEYLLFDFSASAGDTITKFQYNVNDTLSVVLTAINNAEYYGVKGKSFSFYIDHSYTFEDGLSLTVLDSLGIVARTSQWFNEILSGAVIDNVIYGNITSADIQNKKDYDFNLEQNYPNPFNPTTTINYSVSKQSYITINIYDALGRGITSLVKDVKTIGNYSVEFNAANLSSGIYFYRIISGDFVQTKKMIFMK